MHSCPSLSSAHHPLAIGAALTKVRTYQLLQPRPTATPVGFEPTRGDPIGLAGRRLSHSAKVSTGIGSVPSHLPLATCERWGSPTSHRPGPQGGRPEGQLAFARQIAWAGGSPAFLEEQPITQSWAYAHRGYGATAARLTPDQKVGSSNLSALISACRVPMPPCPPALSRPSGGLFGARRDQADHLQNKMPGQNFRNSRKRRARASK